MRQPLPLRVRAVPLVALVALVATVALTLGGCRLANSAPSSVPTDFPGVRRILGAAGIPTEGTVSGDAGCDDRELSRAAISFRASGLDQATPVSAYFFNFDDEEALQKNLGRIATCAASWVTDPATFIEIVEVPYVLVAQGPWAPEFQRVVTDSLREAADQAQ